MKHLIILLLSTIWIMSCERNEIYYGRENSGFVPVRINYDWDTRGLPPGFYTCFYPKDSRPFVDYLDTYGGVLSLSPGHYSILSINNNTESIRFRGTTKYYTFEAYTPTIQRPSATDKGKWEEGITEPDMLYTATYEDFEVYQTSDTLDITKFPQQVVFNYPFTYKGVVGIEYLSLIRASISGMSPSVNISTGKLDTNTAQIFLSLRKTTDGFQGTFRTFGHYQSTDIKHILIVEFIYNNSVTTYNYDVTQMLHNTNRIDITEKIVFDKVSDGGFDTDLGDWGNDEVELPI